MFAATGIALLGWAAVAVVLIVCTAVVLILKIALSGTPVEQRANILRATAQVIHSLLGRSPTRRE